MTHPLPPPLEERLRALRERPIEPVEKGAGSLAPGPGTTGPGPTGPSPTSACLAAARPALHAAGFTYPLLTLRETALAGNLEAMAAYCGRAGVARVSTGSAGRRAAHPGSWRWRSLTWRKISR